MKETKELLDFVLRLAEKIEAGLSDNGKLDWHEMAAMLPTLTLLSDALAGAKDIATELENMTDEGKAEIHALIDGLDLTNPKHEEIAEESLKISLSVFRLIKLIRESK